MHEQSNNNGHLAPLERSKEEEKTTAGKPMTLTDYVIERNWRLAVSRHAKLNHFLPNRRGRDPLGSDHHERKFQHGGSINPVGSGAIFDADDGSSWSAD